MIEIDWKAVAEQYELTPTQLEEQIFIAGSIMGDMVLEKNGDSATCMKFTCEQPTYKIELSVRRADL